MTDCIECGTAHGTATYHHNGEYATYCPDCVPDDATEEEFDGDIKRVYDYPDRRP